MQRNSVTRMCMAAMIVCGSLALGTSLAQANGHCSNRTIDGDYGFSAEGVLLPAPALPSSSVQRAWHILMARAM